MTVDENGSEDNVLASVSAKEFHASSKPAERQLSIDWLRGVAIVGVLILHSGFESRFNDYTLHVWQFTAICFDWSVLAFFFTSGILRNTELTVTETISKRYRSLLIPYFLYHVLYTLLFFLIAQHEIAIEREQIASLVGQLFSPWSSPAFQLYFLPVLFAVTIVGRIISFGACSCSAWTQRLIIASIVSYYVLTTFPEWAHGAEPQKWPLYLAMFLMGALCRDGYKFHKNKISFVWVDCVAALVALLATHGSAWVMLVPPALWFLAKSARSRFIQPLAKTLGRSSGSIYLWHTPLLLPAITILFDRIGFPPFANWILSIAVTLGACLAFRYAINRVFLHFRGTPCPRWITF